MTPLPPRAPGPIRRPDQAPLVCRRRPRNPYFVGRDDVLDDISRQLRNGPVLVHDDPDVPRAGKTQVALEYTHRFGVRYDVVWWFDCADDADLRPQVDGLAEALDRARLPFRLNGSAGGPPPDERCLLVLDGAADAAAVLRKIPAGAGHTLVTAPSADGWTAGGVVRLGRLAPVESVLLVTGMAPMADPVVAGDLADILDHRAGALAEVSSFLLRGEISPAVCLRLLEIAAATRLRPAVPMIPGPRDPVPGRRSGGAKGKLANDLLMRAVESLKQVEPIGEQTTFNQWVRRIEDEHGDLNLPGSAYVKVRLASLVIRCAKHPDESLLRTMIDELGIFAGNDPALPAARAVVREIIVRVFSPERPGAAV
jgi:hypothetical protein